MPAKAAELRDLDLPDCLKIADLMKDALAPGLGQHLWSRVVISVEQFIHEHYPEYEDSLEDLNDTEGHATVMEIFDCFVGRVA
jgi:hypothetical protein